ncbi:MAG: gephyrin-like molybdotransferase Glp [Thermacetogeniaceae bacterium]
MKTHISLEEAQELLIGMISPRGETMVSLPEALGRVISREIKAPRSVPPFDKSLVDGYALRAADAELASADKPVTLQVIGEVAAGSIPAGIVAPGCAVRLMTGSPIPGGADVVVRFEDVEEVPKGIRVKRPLAAGSNIIPAGSEIIQGEIVSQRGERVKAYMIGMLASLGITRVHVYERPRVAIIATGSELLGLDEELQPGKIYCSNRYLLEARCREVGAEPVFAECVPDEEGTIISSLSRALEVADLVVTTGGTSVGRYDFVKDALEAIGAQILFWKIALKPGMPTAAAFKDGKAILSLAGHPDAAMIIFELLAVPIIRKIAGEKEPLPPKIIGVLANAFPKESPYRRIVKARWRRRDGIDMIELVDKQEFNLLVDVPAGSPPLAAGERVSAFVIGSLSNL